MLLTKEIFQNKIARFSSRFPGSSHWSHARWDYHEVAIEFLKKIEFRRVLEIGTMGVQVVSDSVTMDFSVNKDWPIESPDIVHDCRSVPWPFQDLEFDCIVALRVWHHFGEFQAVALNEAMRVSRWVILAVPESYPETQINSRGVSLKDVLSFGDTFSVFGFQKTPQADVYLLKSLL